MSPIDFFAALGLTVVGTGGGNEALATPGYMIDGQPYLLVTDNDGNLPESWDNIAIGAYVGDGECIGFANNDKGAA